MASQEPIFDVAQLSHVELLTPKLDESVRFFKDLLGLQETARDGASVYLRGYEERYHHSLKLTERDQAGLGHMGWRAASQAALERRLDRVRSWLRPRLRVPHARWSRPAPLLGGRARSYP